MVDRAETVDEVLNMSKDKSDKVIVKVQLLQKLAQKVNHGERRERNREIREKTVEDPGFKELVTQIKKEFSKGEEGMNDFKRNTVLYSLMQLRYRDDELLETAC